MGNTGTVSADTATPGEFPCVRPQVYIDGTARNDYYCLSVEASSGVVPGKAILQWLPYAVKAPAEDNSPITLDSYLDENGDSVKELHGSRVVVVADGMTVFAGHMLLRQDSGEADAVIWTAYDDREIMSKIPIRGAVVRDDLAATVKFLPRYAAHTNPQGSWNCIGWLCDIEGHPLNGETIPVFTSRGHIKVSYESPDEAFKDTLKTTEPTAWTPKRFLTYLYFIAHLKPGDLDGISSWSTDMNGTGISDTVWRSLKHARGASYELFDWKYDSITGMIGRDPSDSGLDPLNRKMADMSFQGLAMLQAIVDTLTNAGTHEILFEPQGQYDTEGEGDDQVGVFNGKAKTFIDFYPIGKTAAMASETTFNQIPILREGRPSNLPNVNTAYDFQLSEDSTNTRMSCYVEGDIIRTETRVTIDYGLKKAWTDAEETAFKQIIWGSTESGTKGLKYAWYPQAMNLDNTTIPATASWVTADGTTGKELAYAYSPEAVQIARRLFPRVFRAFKIDSSDAEIVTALKGIDDGSGDEMYKNTAVYPQGQIDRPVLPNQLQYQLADLKEGEGIENKLAASLPIRVTVKNDTEWQDAGWTSAQMIGGGVFLIDMAEQFDDTPQCIYSGHLYSTGSLNELSTLSCTLKELRINLAIPMDHRVNGYAKTSGSYDDDGRSDYMYVNANYGWSTGGEFMQYIDSGETFKEEHQVNSYPTDDGSKKDRLLPPGSEAGNAQYAAQRRLFQTQRINRLSSWKMVGIRPEWKVGMWIDQVEQITVDDDGKISQKGAPYRINGPIRSIVFDFQGKQDTTIGGLIGEI